MIQPTNELSNKTMLKLKLVACPQNDEPVISYGCLDPTDPILRSALRLSGTKHPLIQMDSNEFEIIYRQLEQELHQNEWMTQLESAKSDLESQGGDASDALPVVELVNRLLEEALNEKVTDIHFEPQNSSMLVRYRVDGILEVAHTLPAWVVSAVTSRVKIMADIDISEKRRAQDGQIRWREIDFRVSSMPTQFGEKLVVRILGQHGATLNLDKLDMPDWILRAVKESFAQAQGLFLITGPTGSGKSSTMHAGLRELVGRPINISTIEDPIEYQLEGANQIQLNSKAGFDFADALRSLLRQDPDVIFVGEIRDAETARIAIQAAQTGHLVLSTLHTLDAPSAVQRLMDLDVDQKALNDVLIGVLAQRLVRKLKKSVTPKADNKTLYQGRVGIFEYLELQGTKKYSTLNEDAERKLKLGMIDQNEMKRVLG